MAPIAYSIKPRQCDTFLMRHGYRGLKGEPLEDPDPNDGCQIPQSYKVETRFGKPLLWFNGRLMTLVCFHLECWRCTVFFRMSPRLWNKYLDEDCIQGNVIVSPAEVLRSGWMAMNISLDDAACKFQNSQHYLDVIFAWDELQSCTG